MDYEQLTEELVDTGESPLLFSIGEDDEKYFDWLVNNDVNIPKNILEQILNNGWNDKYIVKIMKLKPLKYFTNPLKSAIIAEKQELINYLSEKFPVDENVMMAIIDEDNVNLLAQLLPKYKGDINQLYDLALMRAAPESAKYLANKGAKSLKPREEDECEKDENGNIIDPFTTEPIPKNRLVSVKEGKKVYCFDLDSLYKNYKATNKFINPFTNKDLPADIVKKIKNYAEKNKTLVTFKPNIPRQDFGPTELEMDRDSELGQVLFDFNEKADDNKFRGRQNFGNFMMLVKIDGKIHRISEYDLTTPMNSLKFDTPFTFIVQDLTLDPYIRVKQGELYPRIYKYAHGKNIPWADTNLIPEIYHRDPPALDQPGKNDLKEFADILMELEDPVGIADFVVNQEKLKILAKDTVILQELIDNKFEGEYKKYLEHILYSRVVDKQNLKARGIEGQYIRNIYQQPDYRILYQP